MFLVIKLNFHPNHRIMVAVNQVSMANTGRDNNTLDLNVNTRILSQSFKNHSLSIMSSCGTTVAQ